MSTSISATAQQPALPGKDDLGEEEDWDDLLGTGTVLKKVLVRGSREAYNEDDEIMTLEAPRKFFALIDIETKYNNKVIDSESHRNYLINSDADLFPGAHLVIPLMEVGETSSYKLDAKFCFGSSGNLAANIPANAKLECTIVLKLRAPYDEFLERLNPEERLKLAERKKNRGKFWYEREDYQNAISIYQTLLDLCSLDKEDKEVEEQDCEM